MLKLRKLKKIKYFLRYKLTPLNKKILALNKSNVYPKKNHK